MNFRKQIDRYTPLSKLNLDDIVTELWTVPDSEDLTQWLQDQSQWIHTGEQTWRHVSESRGYTELELDPEDKTKAWVRRPMKDTNRYFVYLAFVFLPISLFAPSVLIAPILLYPVVGIFQSKKNPLDGAPACHTARDTNSILVLLFIMGVVCIIRDVAGHLSLFWELVSIVGTLLIMIYWAYGINGVPGQSVSPACQFLRIPLIVVGPATMSLGVLLYGVTPTAHLIYIFEMWLEEYGTNPIALGSIFSDFTGGAIRNAGLAKFVLVSDPAWFSLPILAITMIVMFIVNYRGVKRARSLHSDISHLSFPTARPSSDLVFLICVYPVVIVAGLGILAMEGTIIWYGIFDSTLPTAVLLSPFASLAPPDLPQSSIGLMDMIYNFIIASFSIIPIEVTRPMAAGLLSVAYAPLLMIVFALSYGFVGLLFPPQQVFLATMRGVTEHLQTVNTPTQKRPIITVLLKTYLLVLFVLPGGLHIFNYFVAQHSSTTSEVGHSHSDTSSVVTELRTLFYPRLD